MSPPQSQSSPQEEPLTSRQTHQLILGTVQIMIGVTVFSFGVVTAVPTDNIGVTSLSALSGAFVWGAVIFITAGSLTVAAGKSPSPLLAKASLWSNAVALVILLGTMILYALDANGMYLRCYDSSSSDCNLYKTRLKGFGFVLLLFTILGLIVSLGVVAIACIPTSNHDNQQELVYVIPTNTSQAAQDPPPYHTLVVSMAHPAPQVVVSPKPEGYINPGLTEPPAYTRS